MLLFLPLWNCPLQIYQKWTILDSINVQLNLGRFESQWTLIAVLRIHMYIDCAVKKITSDFMRSFFIKIASWHHTLQCNTNCRGAMNYRSTDAADFCRRAYAGFSGRWAFDMSCQLIKLKLDCLKVPWPGVPKKCIPLHSDNCLS